MTFNMIPRPFARATAAFAGVQTRAFTAGTLALHIKAGASVPSVPLFETSPDDKVDLGKLQGKAIIIGVPAAFSPACSGSHIPGFLSHWQKYHDKGYSGLYVVSVNDHFVMNAWLQSLLKDKKKPDFLHLLSDPTGTWSREAETLFDDANAIFGNPRSVRFAAAIEDGKVTVAAVEPTKTSIDVSGAEKFIDSV